MTKFTLLEIGIEKIEAQSTTVLPTHIWNKARPNICFTERYISKKSSIFFGRTIPGSNASTSIAKQRKKILVFGVTFAEFDEINSIIHSSMLRNN